MALNLARGCPVDSLLRELLDNGFSIVVACRMIEEAAVAAETPGTSEPVGKLFLPTALHFETPHAEVYGIDGFCPRENAFT